MAMHATSLIYSSHNCSYDLHYTWMIKRALETGQQRILYLPMSEGSTSSGDDYERQQYGYSKFEWFFERYRHRGLQPAPFYWSKHLSHRDVEVFFEMLRDYEVVVFGGGNPALGMRRYRALGEMLNGDPNMVGSICHDRQSRGLLTCGFSAGADQLAEVMAESAWGDTEPGFGLASRIAVTLHHEAGREQTLLEGARKYPHILWFGLPNDAGVASQQGVLPSGRWWQVIEVVLDSSWDLPRDSWHIKTRSGAKCDHYYADGRHWAFNNGDRIVRVSGNGVEGCWVEAGGRVTEYYSQQPAPFGSVGDVLGSF